MSKRVLVGYATNKGSTVGVAKAIGEVLAERGFIVDVTSLASSPSLEGYDAAVLGSAINGGAWLPFASRYVEANAEALGAIPCAAFCVHGMNAGTGEKQEAKRRAYLAPVRSKVTLTDEGYFLGKLDDMSAIALLAFKAFGGAGEGDLRDYTAIRSWADKLQV